jgi:hypothetical protein
MLLAAYGMVVLMPVAFWVGRARDGVAMAAGRPSSTAESSSGTINPDAEGRCAANGKLATMAKRLRARRARKRREHKEFRAWLQITAKPIW